MDRELVVSAQHGDRVAFMDLVRARVDRLFAIARRILRDVDRAEDALQDALVIAWRDLPSLRDPDRFDYWLQRVLTNMCIEHARRDRRRYAKLGVLVADPVARDELAGVVDRDVVDRAFRRLKAEERAVLVLRYYLGYEPADDRRDARRIGRHDPLSSLSRPPRDARRNRRGRTGHRRRRVLGMNPNLGVDRVLRDYFADDGLLAPDHVLDVIEERIMRQPQRRTWRVPWRDSHVNTNLKPLLAIAAIVVVAVAGFALLRPSEPSRRRPARIDGIPGLAFANRDPVSDIRPVVVRRRRRAGACDLMTADEAGNALHISSLVTTESLLHLDKQSVAPPTVRTGLCNYRSSARSLFVLRYEPGTGADAFAIWEKTPGVEAVSGLGDDAAWAPAKTMLYILKGDLLVTIMPLEGPDPTLTLEAAKAIGAIVATRM